MTATGTLIASNMNWFRQHPATRELQTQQQLARWLQMQRSLRSPRRLWLTGIALLLGLLWLGQAAAGMFFRGPADPVRLQAWLTLGLTGFAIWTLVKTTFRFPVEPFEWTPAEKEWLGGSPLSRVQRVRYRLAGISAAAGFKAFIFTGVMFPDLHLWVAGCSGMYLALMTIELLRMGMEVVMYGLTSRQRLWLQILVSIPLALCLWSAGQWVFGQWSAGEFHQVVSLGCIRCLQEGLQQLPATPLGSIVCAPFGQLASLILSSELDLTLWVRGLAALAILVVLIQGLQWADRVVDRVRVQRERRAWIAGIPRSREQVTALAGPQPGRNYPPASAWGALVWRQFAGLRHYRGTVLFSLALPMLFALMPAFGKQSGWPLVQGMMLVLSFWSFFLLPAALKFDFRRDLNRIPMLKALPLRSVTIVVAQLVVPVAMTTAYQFVTLLLAMIINPFPAGLLLVALAVLVPFNVIVYALENLVFLWFPYRLSEESIRVFLRTILAFTAKGVILAVIAATGLLLLLGSLWLGPWISETNSQTISLLLFATFSFVSGMAASGALIALLSECFSQPGSFLRSRLRPGIDRGWDKAQHCQRGLENKPDRAHWAAGRWVWGRAGLLCRDWFLWFFIDCDQIRSSDYAPCDDYRSRNIYMVP